MNIPLADEPSPYAVRKVAPLAWDVSELVESYFALFPKMYRTSEVFVNEVFIKNYSPQVERQSMDGTHKSVEPVSKSITNVCPGVPIEIKPVQ